jgi:hypothetical protein
LSIFIVFGERLYVNQIIMSLRAIIALKNALMRSTGQEMLAGLPFELKLFVRPPGVLNFSGPCQLNRANK